MTTEDYGTTTYFPLNVTLSVFIYMQSQCINMCTAPAM